VLGAKTLSDLIPTVPYNLGALTWGIQTWDSLIYAVVPHPSVQPCLCMSHHAISVCLFLSFVVSVGVRVRERDRDIHIE
jgi:hypothetical protein